MRFLVRHDLMQLALLSALGPYAQGTQNTVHDRHYASEAAAANVRMLQLLLRIMHRKRTARFATYGFAVHGPTCHFFYRWLDSVVVGTGCALLPMKHACRCAALQIITSVAVVACLLNASVSQHLTIDAETAGLGKC